MVSTIRLDGRISMPASRMLIDTTSTPLPLNSILTATMIMITMITITVTMIMIVIMSTVSGKGTITFMVSQVPLKVGVLWMRWGSQNGLGC